VVQNKRERHEAGAHLLINIALNNFNFLFHWQVKYFHSEGKLKYFCPLDPNIAVQNENRHFFVAIFDKYWDDTTYKALLGNFVVL